MPGRDEPKVAIVTGASRGIGLAIARTLLDRGDLVCLTSRDGDELLEVADRLPRDRALAVVGKAQDREHQADVVARTMDRFGRIDFFVNNVGINPVYGPVVDLDLDVVWKIIDTNLVAALGWTQRVHAAWMADHGGAIVYISSITGLRPAAGIGIYGMTKAALIHLTGQLAIELSPGVRVNSVAPGLVKTRFAASAYQGREEELAADYPLARLGEPTDIAGAVAFLLSDNAEWITGHTLTVDGGRLLVGGAQ
jgi:NAD(P)-dependent dehydrogenase (short-subunit alcohol dehydrogenase family)